jgi:hypothetical protein
MQIPLASNITLVMEIIIASIIFFLVFKGYKENIFFKKLAYFAVGYEIVFNVGYMIYRSVSIPSASNLSTGMRAVAAAHGILSLLMLFAVVFFFLRAAKEYAKGLNSFVFHKVQTFLFLAFWVISLLSGIFLYVKTYF